MARIIGAIATSHTPTIGFALAANKQLDPVWKPIFDDVHVGVENTLGEVNQGWRVAMATAGFERGVSLRSPARFSKTAERLVHLWRQHADPSDSALRDAVVDVWMQAEGYKLHTYMTVTQMIEGATIGAEASLNKIFWSEMDVRIPELALDIAGPEAERMDGPFERWVRDDSGATAVENRSIAALAVA